jgi:hypothetical protein
MVVCGSVWQCVAVPAPGAAGVWQCALRNIYTESLIMYIVSDSTFPGDSENGHLGVKIEQMRHCQCIRGAVHTTCLVVPLKLLVYISMEIAEISHFCRHRARTTPELPSNLGALICPEMPPNLSY